MTNADKKEVAEKFWKYSKQWIDLPDIRYSGPQWEIHNGRIRAPLGLIQGIGPAAHDELCSGRPYSDINSLTNHIAAVKLSKTKINEETGKKRIGTSALNKGVISKLIATGVMDSFFTGDNLTIYDKLVIYEEALAKSLGKKKPAKPDEKFLNFNALTLFQFRKSILPVYHEDLLPALYRSKQHGIVEEPSKKCSFKYAPSDPVILGNLLHQKGGNQPICAMPLVNGPQLKYLNEDIQIYDGQLVTCAAAGYITMERPFSYRKDNKTKYAVELTFDVDGEQFKVVKWPPRDKSNKAIIPNNLTGTIAILLVSRYRSDRPFVLDAIEVVIPALNLKEAEENE